MVTLRIYSNDTPRRAGISYWPKLAVIALLLIFGCHRAAPGSAAKPSKHASCGFDIHWPVEDPEQPSPLAARALLQGELKVNVQPADSDAAAIEIAITLTRPSTESDREYWNSALAFSHIRWMDQVRVWDADKKWLWPNLAYLFRLPGKERVERYGGIDPGKQIDNDFAAVLIRKYDAAGKVASADTKDAPLVSAEWHPVAEGPTDLHSIVHAARSDVFTLRVGKDSAVGQGQFKVWLIYADFFGARIPATWPKAKEYAGGILAYFEIDWTTSGNDGVQCVVRQKRPPEGTGFDWAAWAVHPPSDDHAEAKQRVMD